MTTFTPSSPYRALIRVLLEQVMRGILPKPDARDILYGFCGECYNIPKETSEIMEYFNVLLLEVKTNEY